MCIMLYVLTSMYCEGSIQRGVLSSEPHITHLVFFIVKYKGVVHVQVMLQPLALTIVLLAASAVPDR